MEARQLGRTELTTVPLMMGTMTFGSQVAEPEARAMVEACLDAGITLFDTAINYNEGESEAMLGRLLKGRRQEVQIATKVGYPIGYSPGGVDLSPPAIRKAIDSSLGRLQTDYVDLYYLHAPDAVTPIEESLGALQELVEVGKVRHVGISNYAAWQLVEMQWVAERQGWQPVEVGQQLYNLLNRRLEDEYAACAERFGVATVVYNPLAGGLLTGKHRPEAVPKDESRFSLSYYRERYWNRQHFEAVNQLQEFAGQAGLTLLELAFRWLLSRPLVDGVLLGASSPRQLAENLAACAGPAPDEETCRRCDEVWRWLRGVPIRYNR